MDVSCRHLWGIVSSAAVNVCVCVCVRARVPRLLYPFTCQWRVDVWVLRVLAVVVVGCSPWGLDPCM